MTDKEQQDAAGALHAAASITEAYVRRTQERAALNRAAAVLLGRARWFSLLLKTAGHVCLREARKT